MSISRWSLFQFTNYFISMSQYNMLTQDSWQEWLVPKLRVKLSMPDLTKFDINTSCWNAKDPQQEGFMAGMRSGGLFTNRVKSRISCVVSPNCVLCGQPEGMRYRIYHCSATQQIRVDLGFQHLEHVPRSGLLWGLFEKPAAAELYAKA